VILQVRYSLQSPTLKNSEVFRHFDTDRENHFEQAGLLAPKRLAEEKGAAMKEMLTITIVSEENI